MTIEVTNQNHISIVTINNPPVNALARADVMSIMDHFMALGASDGIRAAILTGAGTKAFCAGLDYKRGGDRGGDYGVYKDPRDRGADGGGADAIWDCRVPVIGAINGPALGGGLVMAACCDYLIGSTNAQFGLPQIWMGSLGGGGHAYRIFPQGLARRMQYTGEYVSAKRAFEVGALQELVDPEKLMDRALEEANKLSTKVPEGMKAAKEATTGLEDPPLIIGVTMLTSLNEKDVNEVGIQDISNQVLSLASLAKKSSLDGIVCSADDVISVKELLGKNFVTVTPGIRSSDSSKDDQSRVSSARNAIEKGADYLVIGRPITKSTNPMESLDSIIKEIS